MPKHTAGPWHVRPKPPAPTVSEHGEAPFTIGAPNNRLVARIAWGDAAANAALIAASPDMYAALRNIFAAWDELEPIDDAGMVRAIENARDALDKAEGR